MSTPSIEVPRSDARLQGQGEEFEIRNVNGVAELKVTLDGPGVYVARGPNGSGKTSTLEALKAASGDKSAKAEPSDGTREGTVTMRGGVLLSVGQKRKSNGLPAVSLVSAGALGMLIDPGLKDPDLAARSRLKALLSLLPMPADADALKELTGGSDTLWSEFSLWLQREGRPVDALELADMVRRRANDLALQAEKDAAAASGTVNELGELIRSLGTVDVDAGPLTQAVRAEHEAEVRAAELAVGAKAREDLVQRQTEIRGTLGNRPDVTKTTRIVEGIKRDIANTEALLAEMRSELKHAVGELVTIEQDQKTYDSQSEILRRPVTGPSPEEAANAHAEAEKCRARTARARVFDQAMTYRERMKKAEELNRNAAETGKRLRSIAQGTADVLGRLLEKRGVPGLTIREGRLMMYVENESPLGSEPVIAKDFDTRLSFGERVRAAIEVALAGIHVPAGALPVLPLEPTFWLALDTAHKAEVNTIARERGVCLVTEEPVEGALRVERMTNDE